jgi:2-C-methyl-D-erythritol 4-phosphate cytidylyltransferase
VTNRSSAHLVGTEFGQLVLHSGETFGPPPWFPSGRSKVVAAVRRLRRRAASWLSVFGGSSVLSHVVAPLTWWPRWRSTDRVPDQRSRAAADQHGGGAADQHGRAAAVVLAGGSGTRVGGESNKVYLPVAGRIMIGISLNTFAALPEIGPLVLVVRAEDRELATQVLDREVDRAVEVVIGGSTRQESELAGLRQLAGRIEDGHIDTVLIHDGARPFAGRPLVREVLRVTRECGGAVPGLPRDDLAVAGPGGGGLAGPAPEGLVAVQTPQGFSAAPLLAAYEQAAREGFAGTDTASCMQRFAPTVPIRWVAGEARNFKITYPHDLVLADEMTAPPFGECEKV